MTARAPETIRTERLLLRRWTARDAVALRRLLDDNDAHLRPWIPFMQQEPRSLAATRRWLDEICAAFTEGRHFRYAIERGGEVVGETMLIGRGVPDMLEAGYWLAREHCGAGLATEATAALVPIAFDALGRRRVIVRCDVRNAASLRVAEKLGGVRCASERLHENGDTVELAVFEIHAEGRSSG